MSNVILYFCVKKFKTCKGIKLCFLKTRSRLKLVRRLLRIQMKENTNERAYKILEIRAKSLDKLPEKYLERVSSPRCYYDRLEDCLVIINENQNIKRYELKVDEVVPEFKFKCILIDLEKCSKNLKNINKEIRKNIKINKRWCKVITFWR